MRGEFYKMQNKTDRCSRSMEHVGDEFTATLDGSINEIGLLLEALTDAGTYSHGSGEA